MEVRDRVRGSEREQGCSRECGKHVREREDSEDGKLRGLRQTDAPQRVGMGTQPWRLDVDLVTAAQEGAECKAPSHLHQYGHMGTHTHSRQG
jgi:hypothetical protein